MSKKIISSKLDQHALTINVGDIVEVTGGAQSPHMGVLASPRTVVTLTSDNTSIWGSEQVRANSIRVVEPEERTRVLGSMSILALDGVGRLAPAACAAVLKTITAEFGEEKAEQRFKELLDASMKRTAQVLAAMEPQSAKDMVLKIDLPKRHKLILELKEQSAEQVLPLLLELLADEEATVKEVVQHIMDKAAQGFIELRGKYIMYSGPSCQLVGIVDASGKFKSGFLKYKDQIHKVVARNSKIIRSQSSNFLHYKFPIPTRIQADLAKTSFYPNAVPG
ncbi:hypothetical protein HN511_07110 [bacterium]|jgi:hypothetical protein|nr:hypothetical protein [bacterium]